MASLYSRMPHLSMAGLFLGAMLVTLFATTPVIASYAVSAYDTKISAMDTQGNKYEAWYLQDQFSATGWSFYARKTTSTGFITQQQYTVGSPCDSASNQMRLRISYDMSTQSWVVSFTHAIGALNSKSFPGGGTTIQSGTYGHDYGANVIIDSDTHASSVHDIFFHHAFPICPAAPQP
jgi:hypothetical protein